MRLADEVLPIPGEEPAIPVIQANRDMAANVFVGNEFPGKTGEKAFSHSVIRAFELELNGLPIRKLAGFGDEQSFHPSKIRAIARLKKFKAPPIFEGNMKAFQLISHGAPGKMELRDVPKPSAAAGEVAIRVRACGLNRLDLWAEEGGLPVTMELPRTLGGEISGEITAVGNGVKGLRLGDRVAVQSNVFCGDCEFCVQGEESICLNGKLLGVHRDGGFAEEIVVPAQLVVSLPEEVSFENSAALTLAGSTAMHMLTKRTKVEMGDWVLVIGAGSGVGSAAIQVAKQLGAYVITTGSSEAKRTFGKELGADYAVDSNDPNWPAEVRKITQKHGVDVVVEHVGGDVLVKCFECLARNGVIVTCGATSGRNVQINLWPFFVKQHSLVGSYGRNRDDIVNTLQWAADGKIKAPVYQSIPLDRAAEAFKLLRDRAVMGKVVITP